MRVRARGGREARGAVHSRDSRHVALEQVVLDVPAKQAKVKRAIASKQTELPARPMAAYSRLSPRICVMLAGSVPLKRLSGRDLPAALNELIPGSLKKELIDKCQINDKVNR